MTEREGLGGGPCRLLNAVGEESAAPLPALRGPAALRGQEVTSRSRGPEGTCQEHNSSALSAATRTKAETTYLVSTWSLLRCSLAERFLSASVDLGFLLFALSQTSGFAEINIFPLCCFGTFHSSAWSLRGF